MASEFLQMVVVVELRNPPERLYGSVTDLEAGQSLTLSNVWSLNSHTWHPQIIVDPGNIAEIFDASKDPRYAHSPSPMVPAPNTAHIAVPTHTTHVENKSITPVLGDPAIVSFRPLSERPASSLSQNRAMNQTRHIATGEASFPPPTYTVAGVSVQESSLHDTPISAKGAIGSTLEISNGTPELSDKVNANTNYAVAGNPATTSMPVPRIPQHDVTPKTRRRQRQQRGAKSSEAKGSVDLTPERSKQLGKGEGWRDTPMLQSTASFQPFKSLKNSSKRREKSNQDNGWASEDATDVQEMGDFDFEESLAKFDKHALFDQMRKHDQIDDADRLVTHNRQPGTAGGKNFHHTENVLGYFLPSVTIASKIIPKEPRSVSEDFWNSETDETHTGGAPGVGAASRTGGGDRLSGRDLGNRQGSRRSDSKVSNTRRSQSRKASGAGTVGQGPSRVNSIAPLSSAVSTTQHFYVLPSERRLETVSALQMLNLENIAHNELGLSEDMMTENAGRGIAEVALETLSDPANKIRLKQADLHSKEPSTPLAHGGSAPTIVILVGNNKSGTRAVAGGRHLRNKGINVILCVVGIERGERELLDDLRQQIRTYRNFGGRVYNKNDLFEHLRKTVIPTLAGDTPRSAVSATVPAVTLIIDALLGIVVSFDELRTGDQATVYELMEWANRNEAFVLAVDVPTGIDPSSGYVSIIDGARLYVRPRYVIALGAPKRGLLEAMAAAELGDTAAMDAADDQPLDWRLFVADIGLGAAVWKKAGTKIRRGIDFDEKWVLEMKYHGLETDDESV
ncbi:enhancer of mRNA-decapping protein 3 [Sporothrix schenckii 1099-18]|uniref:Enhancer of mRNA-decapping protein 3 n=1 Tax=Sporothrix schenckii 1099-18 TaxID=1397361 RepID=A0A0F2MJT9_SPOSC|nr:enhancer of mRNA-decapping protein 3 [Sporothrix schenckii 1099-18]KJR89897.1 enhancer of mRNA-decapping protein 3 [Sporothrix schenckii 1099-18]